MELMDAQRIPESQNPHVQIRYNKKHVILWKDCWLENRRISRVVQIVVS